MNGCDYLIVAVSGRALAQSARRAGLVVHVIDQFGDSDTREAAAAVTVVPAAADGGFEAGALRAAVAALPPTLPLVAGSGFEDATALLADIGRDRPCLGNRPALIERLQRPASFFSLLDKLAIPHPAVMTAGTAPDAGWLAKRSGGRGGGHVRRARPGAALADGHYLQRRAPGHSMSALLLADGTRAAVLGGTRHWRAQRGPGHTFRRSGMVGLPDAAGASWHHRMQAMATALVQATGLVGLCGLDFILTKGIGPNGKAAAQLQVLELNPRPPASFELHEHGQSLFAAHLEACRGRLPAVTAAAPGLSQAAAVLYARHAASVPPAFRWPAWTADRPPGGTRLPVGAPICTVFGDAPAPSAACLRVRDRLRHLQRALGQVATGTTLGGED